MCPRLWYGGWEVIGRSRRVPATLGALDTVPDGVVLRCNAGDLDWLAQFLIGIGRPFTVRQPPDLAAVPRQRAAGIARGGTCAGSRG